MTRLLRTTGLSRDSTCARPRLKHDPDKSIVARIGFLKKDPIFDHEEPYAFRYQADGLEKLTNMKMEMEQVMLCDLRGQEENACLDTCGFEIRTLRSSMTYEQFASQDCIAKIYVEDIKTQLREDTKAVHVSIERVRVRRRHPEFPRSIGADFEHHQPSTAAHIDVTSESAATKAEQHFDATLSIPTTGHYQIINIWKPLRGPLHDWPLGLCDASTVDVNQDLAESTVLHEDYMNHNCQVHFNNQQKWYYLRDQRPDELIVFRQFDSKKGHNNGTPHSSFQDRKSTNSTPPRESIEIMAILYF